MRRPIDGEIDICGENTTDYGARQILRLGVSHIPGDRHKFSMIGPMNIEENLILVSYKESRYSKAGLLNWKWISKHSDKICTAYGGVKTSHAKETAKKLSGSNQQKMVVGREPDRNP